jgi:hypothetical protein
MSKASLSPQRAHMLRCYSQGASKSSTVKLPSACSLRALRRANCTAIVWGFSLCQRFELAERKASRFSVRLRWRSYSLS